jgi:hypothetical protein
VSAKKGVKSWVCWGVRPRDPEKKGVIFSVFKIFGWSVNLEKDSAENGRGLGIKKAAPRVFDRWCG